MGLFSKLISAESNQDDKNPLYPVLDKYVTDFAGDLEEVAARLGFAMTIIYSDMQVADEEVAAFKGLVLKYLGVAPDVAGDIARDAFNIDQFAFQISYFSRILNAKLTEDERRHFLQDLFKVAYSDDEYAQIEERDLRLIVKSLFLRREDFVHARQRAKGK